MSRTQVRLAAVAAVALVAATLHQTVALATNHDRTRTVTEANTPANPVTWEGNQATGANQTYSSSSGEPCGKDVNNYCDVTLLNVDVQASFWETRSGGLSLGIGNYSPDPNSDFDLYVYRSDDDGTRGALVDDSAGPPGEEEQVFIRNATGYYLVQVVYFQVVESRYTGQAALVAGPAPDPIAETRFFFHQGDVPVNQLDDATFNDEPPTGAEPAVAPGSFFLGGTWSGEVPEGRIRTLGVDFWQKAPVDELLLGEANYEVTLTVGEGDDEQEFAFPPFTATTKDDVPSRVTHVFTPKEADVLPIDLTNNAGDSVPVTIFIVGRFLDGEAVTVILYDSEDFPSGFSINVPPLRREFPFDVDTPRGLQEALASDPASGWTSRSEMHIAQNPLDQDMLIAGSKFYNRDPDALDEYEFKIGTYVSFNGGRRWEDLGQLEVCSISQAPEETWPDRNRCYPRDNPEKDNELAEEYITSDPWVQFDDEGNAYIMVLDHPPFDRVGEGNGWGMTTHTWKSVSRADVESGNTWGPRTPINFYDDDLEQRVFLDDKNTFTVNNGGRDNDGKTGIMVACWGQTIEPLIKQQIVCERSTDGGQSWPGEPRPISDVQHLVIGVHVIADPQDPRTFYATWMQYATGGSGGNIGGELTPETLEFAVSHDGGQTWAHRELPVSLMTQIPRQFPGQRFRNLSIPILAVGPNSQLYITWAEYFPASRPDADEDGREADIVIVKSTDDGATWSDPTLVNTPDERPNANADQFQPYVTVAESGQLNVIYFDRRLDRRIVDDGIVRNAGNYFTDVFLARSNDGGRTFSEHRLTHDSTDPEHNAPVSPSGLFFGDYQGLVADECFAIPFVNDTHLANDAIDPGPERDPAFDDGLPSSPYQEAVSWRVPNTKAFGGPAKNLPDGCVPPPPPVPCPDVGVNGEIIAGTEGDNVLVGTPKDDVICGGPGDDTIDGRGGDDLLFGGSGRDTLVGRAGGDELQGGKGSDILRGLQNGDVLTDRLGTNVLKGGRGADELSSGDGADNLLGGHGDDTLASGKGADLIRGGDGGDDGRGGDGNDDLRGRTGNDHLRGGDGADSLRGGPDADLLDGKDGHDACDGGTGADTVRNCEATL